MLHRVDDPSSLTSAQYLERAVWLPAYHAAVWLSLYAAGVVEEEVESGTPDNARRVELEHVRGDLSDVIDFA